MKVVWIGVCLDADSESTPRRRVKLLPWKVMGKKLSEARDKLVKHAFDFFGLGLFTASGLWLGIRVYMKPFCSAAK